MPEVARYWNEERGEWRALLASDPVLHAGPEAPTGPEELWVDTDEDIPTGGGAASWDDLTGKPTVFPSTIPLVDGLQAALDNAGGGEVTSADITDASTVGKAVLTAPLSVDARNALSIFTGTRALLDAGTDTAERTWDAKELHEYVTDQVAAAGGAASWDELTGKPETFPPATHTHDDRYYTEAEVDAKIAAAVAVIGFDTNWRNVVPLIPESVYISGDFWARREGRRVWLHFEDLRLTGTSSSVNPGFSLPVGWRPTPTYLYLPFAKRTDAYSAGPMRVSKYGGMDFYDHRGQPYTGDVSFLTDDAPPTAPLGTTL